MKKISYLFLGVILVSSLTGCSVEKEGSSENTQNDTQATEEVQPLNSTTKKELETINSTTKKELATIDLSGTFYTTSGETAKIKSISTDQWEIAYSTLDGDVTASFETKWKQSGQTKQSKTPMRKSDTYSGFNVLIEYVNPSDIKITMGDGNAAHEMVFTKEQPKEDDIYEVVLQGDLSPFAGQFSSDDFNKTIAESGFTYGAYSPEDYFNNRTTVFPGLSKSGYWNGITSHGNYEVRASDMPRKVDGYYEVHVYGTNPGANNGELTFFLVPPKVSGPDGTLSDERRVFQVSADGQPRLMEYQKEEWWKEYQAQ